jgi:hypothetical protein
MGRPGMKDPFGARNIIAISRRGTFGYQAARYLFVLAVATFEYGLKFPAASTAWTRNR